MLSPYEQTLVVVTMLTMTAASAAAAEMRELNAEAVHARLEAEGPKPLVVDVREPEEFASGHIAGSLPAPLGGVEETLANVPKDREIILVCRSGRRSGIAHGRLEARGYTNLTNMAGGMLE